MMASPKFFSKDDFCAVVLTAFGVGLFIFGSGCRPEKQAQIKSIPAPDPLAIALAMHAGDSPIDRQIANVQKQIRDGKNVSTAIEQLGWLYVSKARASFDPGYYKLAEQCALALDAKQPHTPEALLLRGHVLQSLHHFKEAEPLARELTEVRGRSFDYGLLGDVLMEQGRLDEAVVAYQKMADIKPDLHAYTRVAYMRWLTGDLAGATDMMQMAEQASSAHDAESAAWVYSHMAMYKLQAGDLEQALAHCVAAEEFQTNYPPALLVRAKIFLLQGKNSEAVAALTLAETQNPLPEYQWALIEALHSAGREAEAAKLDGVLKQRGEANDPRTFALYLATCGGDPLLSIRLAKAELQTRADVFTYDALAWALAAGGRWNEALTNMQQALTAGTQDGRLYFHAGIIAAETARPAMAEKYLREAWALKQMLLPSERAKLAQCANRLGLNFPQPAALAQKNFSEQPVLYTNENSQTQKTKQKGVSSL